MFAREAGRAQDCDGVGFGRSMCEASLLVESHVGGAKRRNWRESSDQLCFVLIMPWCSHGPGLEGVETCS